MSLFPDLFVDPSLRARQDQLNATWNGLRASYGVCQNTPDASFAEFTTDYNAWQAFYASESDWTTDSFNATNSWQQKAVQWANNFKAWGCTGSDPENSGNDTPVNGLPIVKDAPPDEKGSVGQAASSIGDAIKNGLAGVWNTIETVGWVVVGLIVLILGGIVYLLTHTNVSTPTASIGPAK
jgi:hypothetical protein